MTLSHPNREELANDPLLAAVPVEDGWKVLPPTVLHSKIGQGAMGAVYRAKHLELKIDVAVKCLKSSAEAEHEESVPRFQREARLAAKLSHQNLVRIYELRREYNLSYLVLELVEGETAQERVQRKGPLPELQTVKILLAVARGLALAHRHPEVIIHRDIKPSNILISKRGEVKLADLGLAKAVEREGQTAPLTKGILGTPWYMSPEQWDENARLGPATDIWAMGMTLYYLLTGQHAMNGCSVNEMQSGGSSRDFPDPRRVRDDLSEGILKILQCCTEREPGNRYADASELARGLQSHLRTQVAASASSARKGGGRSRYIWLVVGTCAASLALAFLWNRNERAGVSAVPGSRRAWLGGHFGATPTPTSIDAETGRKVPTGWAVEDGTPAFDNWAMRVRELKSGITFVLIPPGEFLMGSPEGEPGRDEDEAQHRVEITSPFYMSETEVTFKEFYKGSDRPIPKGIDPLMPVMGVDWQVAREFCGVIGCSLPTEAQWEYAARAGSSGRFWWGDEPTGAEGKALALGLLPPSGHHFASALPAGGREPNAFGLRDMSGNVWEWCSDGYIKDYETLSMLDPFEPPLGSVGTLRGGAWNSVAEDCRVANRMEFSMGEFPSDAKCIGDSGLRVVLTLR